MRLLNLKPEFNLNPYLTEAIDKQHLLNSRLENFDKDGYEIEKVERLFYKQNNVTLNTEIQEHSAPVQ